MIEYSLLAIGISLIIYGIYKWATLNHNYFKNRGIAHLNPNFIFGNTFGFFMRQYSQYDFVEKVYNSFPNEKVIGLFDFRIPFYAIRDPDIIKQLAVKDFDNFEDHRSFIDDNSDKLFGNSLFMLKGEKWRDMRATLSPAFTGSKMRQMFELVTECAIDMASHFKEIASKGTEVHCEMKDIFSKYANDVIATSAFGIRVNSFKDKDNEFFKAGLAFGKLNTPLNGLKLFLLRLMPSIMKAFDIQLMSSGLHKFFTQMVLGNIKSREENGIFRPDMINILMQVKRGSLNNKPAEDEENHSNIGFATVEESNIGKQTVKRQWNNDEIVAQCFLFFAAGFDTSSTMLSFLTYELCINPDIQQKLYEEIVEVNKLLDGKSLNYDILQKMQYMDLVISETLRKWPPAGITDRVCNKDYTYNDGNVKFTMEKGQFFWIPIYSLHRDPEYFPNPEKFDPERFNDDNKNGILPGTYLPFGIGPRNCIGSRFALMEIKAVIYYMLLDFKLMPNKDTQIPLKLSKTPFNIKSENGVHVQLKLRNK